MAAPKTLQGDVQYQIDGVPDDKRYKRIPGMVFLPSAPLDNPKPVYPASQLQKRLPPVNVSVTLIVDPQGNIERVTPIHTEGVPVEFIDATVAALSKWAFAPLEQFDGTTYGSFRIPKRIRSCSARRTASRA